MKTYTIVEVKKDTGEYVKDYQTFATQSQAIKHWIKLEPSAYKVVEDYCPTCKFEEDCENCTHNRIDTII